MVRRGSLAAARQQACRSRASRHAGECHATRRSPPPVQSVLPLPVRDVMRARCRWQQRGMPCHAMALVMLSCHMVSPPPTSTHLVGL